MKLSRVVMNPTRPQLDAVLEIPEVPAPKCPPNESRAQWIENHRLAQARERWEACAARGLIPTSWIEDPLRKFRGTVATYPDYGAPQFRVMHFSYPPTVELVLSLASDPEGVLGVEALAKEAVRNSIPFPSNGELVIEWVRNPVPTRGIFSSLLQGMGWQLARINENAPGDAESYRERIEQMLGAPASDALVVACFLHLAQSWWKRACEDGFYRTDAGMFVAELPRKQRGVLLRECADPFEPVLEIFSRGYRLMHFENTSVVLCAPDLC